MTSEDLSEWLAYDQLDGVTDHWLIAGVITANLWNAWTGDKKRPEDFIGRKPPVRIVSGEAGLAWFKAAAAQAAAAEKAREAMSRPVGPH